MVRMVLVALLLTPAASVGMATLVEVVSQTVVEVEVVVVVAVVVVVGNRLGGVVCEPPYYLQVGWVSEAVGTASSTIPLPWPGCLASAWWCGTGSTVPCSSSRTGKTSPWRPCRPTEWRGWWLWPGELLREPRLTSTLCSLVALWHSTCYDGACRDMSGRVWATPVHFVWPCSPCNLNCNECLENPA